MFNKNSGARSQNEKIKIKIVRGIFQSNSGFRLLTPNFFTGYLRYPVNYYFISSISIIEIISNLKRLFEIDNITTEKEFQHQRSFFYQDVNTLDITILDVTAEDIIKAESLILKHYMKPIDSIQLAIALNLKHDDITFVSSDQRLCKIAAAEDIMTLNP